MRSRIAVAVLGWFLLAAGLSLPASGQAAGGPEGIHIAYGLDPARSVTVMWHGPPSADAAVEYGPEGGEMSDRVAASAEPLPGPSQVAYHARIDGLAPDTVYTYRAVLDGETSEAFPFRTALPKRANASLNVTMFADHGVPADSPLARYDGDSQIRNVELASSMNASMHIIAGDVSYANGDPRVWDTYFETFQDWYATTPLMTVPGNHEREPGQGYTQYDARLEMPTGEGRHRWYRFVAGNAMFIGLNSDTICVSGEAVQVYPIASWYCARGQDQARRPNPDQLAFLEESLQQARQDDAIRWTVVYFHNPTYSDGPHGSNPDVQALWVPLFDEYGVDLVLNGDDHFYSRSHPLDGGEVNGTGTTYIVHGAAGAEMYEFEHDEPREWEARRYNEEYGTLHLSLTPDRIVGRFVDLDGTEIDRFAIGHTASGRPTQVPLTDAPEPSEGGGPASDAPATTPGLGLAALAAALAVAAAIANRR